MSIGRIPANGAALSQFPADAGRHAHRVISWASGQGPVLGTRSPACSGCPSHPGEGPASAEQTCLDLLDPTFLSGGPFLHLSRAHWEVALGSHGARLRGHRAIRPQASPCFQVREPSWVQPPVSAETAGWDPPTPTPQQIIITNLCMVPVPSR